MPADRAALLELAARVEAATGPSRELDAEIALQLVGRWEQADRHIHSGALRWNQEKSAVLFSAPSISWSESWVDVPRLTASLDAVMTLYSEPPPLIPSNPRRVVRDALRALAAAQTEGSGNG